MGEWVLLSPEFEVGNFYLFILLKIFDSLEVWSFHLEMT